MTILRAISSIVRHYRCRTDPVGYARSIGVTLGAGCRLLGVTPSTFGSEPYLIRIGARVTIAGGVRFITHDGGVWVFRTEHPEIDRMGPIVIEDDAFVGLNAVLLPGARIGRGSVVGAGSVVTKQFGEHGVIAGTPARWICTTQDYWARRRGEFTHIRSLPEDAKRRILLDRFKDELSR